MKFTFTNQPEPVADDFLSREYLLTNGRGGYASSTLCDCNTRKYHGLLALPVASMGKVYLLLSKIELSVVSGGTQYDLSVNKFPDTIFPDGFRHIKTVIVGHNPVTTYLLDEGNITLEKALLMPRGEDSVLIRYTLLDAKKPVVLKLAPFLAYREIHGIGRQNADIRPRTYFETGGFKIDPYANLPPLYMQTSRHSTFYPAPDWWKDFEYPEEQARGYTFHEDLFTPGIFEVKLKKGDSVIVRAALDSSPPNQIEKKWRAEESRVSFPEKQEEVLALLKKQAEHFIVDKPAALLAGFPWFCTEWGRDTFISLPGLLLATKQFQKAFEILEKFGSREKNGLLPNIIGADGAAAYNSIDSSFWFCRTVQQYLSTTKDTSGVQNKLLPVIESILVQTIQGKTEKASIGEDGLLYAGNSMTQLTWMDASIHESPVTPRHGAAVEVNALYYNALVFVLTKFAPALKPEHKALFDQKRKLFEENFPKLFWNNELCSLFDVYRSPTDKDAGIRPNQLFAIGLPYTCIESQQALSILETVKINLVTPFGLRTLSPHNENFVSVYEGSQESRDAAYHQGMIWPWLIGIFYDALIKHSPEPDTVKAYFKSTFGTLWESHLGESCLFQVNEIFTPVIPHRAVGCPAQAWSLAEIIRVLDETSA